MKRKSKLVAFIQEISRIWTLERPTVLAAALAYFGMFAFAPVIFISLTIAGFFVDQLALANKMLEALSTYLGPEITEFIQNTVVNLTASNASIPIIGTIISFAAILYAASGLFYQLQYSLNVIWKIPPPEKGLGKFFLKKRLVSLLMVAASGVLLILALMVFGVISWLESNFSVGFNLSIGNPLAVWLLVTLSFSLMYKYLPDIRVKFREVLPGAASAGFLITLVLLLYSAFFRLGSFSTAFAATGAVVIFLIGLNLFANIFLLGAVIGRTIHGKQNTESPAQPPGQ
jgi:membrane protein